MTTIFDYRLGASFVMGGNSGGRRMIVLRDALAAQARGESFWLVVPDLKAMDYCIAFGIKPSNIRLPSEFRTTYEWQTAHIGIFYE